MWFTTTQSLLIPSQSFLIGPYSPSSLPPLSPASFHSTAALTHRLRHADLLLYSLLTYIHPPTAAQLPLWPPLDHQAALKLRAELSKAVEKVLKAEKDTWKKQLTWRRSFLDEAKGERWEMVLDALACVALRTSLESKELQSEWVDLPPLASLSNPASIAESTAHALQLYLTESHLASSLIQHRTTELANLRQQGRELLETRASLLSGSKTKKEHSELDLLHLKALRDQRAQKMRAGMWELMMRGDPRAIVGGGGGGEAAQPRPNANPLSAPSSSFITAAHPTSQLATPSQHLTLLHSLSTLSDPPPPIPLPSSTPTSTRQTQPPDWAGAFELDRRRLGGMATPLLTPPTSGPHTASRFDFSSPPSSRSASSFSTLLRPPPSSSSSPGTNTRGDEDDSLEHRIAHILDSLDPFTPAPPPPPPPKELGLAGAGGGKGLKRSRLPERVKVRPAVRDGDGEDDLVQREGEREKEPLKEVQPARRPRSEWQELQEAPTPKPLEWRMGKDAERVLEEMLGGESDGEEEGVGGVSYSQ